MPESAVLAYILTQPFCRGKQFSISLRFVFAFFLAIHVTILRRVLLEGVSSGAVFVFYRHT